MGLLSYLGSLVTENSDNNTDIKARIMVGNTSYYSVLPLLRSKPVSRKTKIRMYKTTI
jgi:predicted metalloprotease with PDZ domain